ncbi:25562_t:CDS:1, partial [Racocetra persica]
TDEPEINDVFTKVNKRIKTQEIENNKNFSKLSDNEKEVLRKEWVDSIVSTIETSCHELRYLIDDTKIAVNARNELEKMSFLQIRALHVALILRKNIFITGDAGTGKTRVLKFIIAYYSIIHRVNIEITASTGKAALELKSSGKTGRTIHSVFKFGKNISPNKIKWKLRDKGYCDWLRKVRAIIIDECSMVNDDLLDSI